uniref:Uncharacterized protein n=1 Tax=Arundo donax TaxID=35708 RepID=A0A0A9A9R3_ARUDO
MSADRSLGIGCWSLGNRDYSDPGSGN